MMGLTGHARDLYLPAELGDPRLRPPSERELVDLVNERLCLCKDTTAPESCAVSARVMHVRYKPSVAAAATYLVTAVDGSEHAVTYKVHLGERAEDCAVGGRYAEMLEAACAPLRPFAHLPSRKASLWVFPADPQLRGAVRAMDARRMARWIDRLGIAEPWTAGQRPSEVTLRRYKHSRRAVFHVLTHLKGDAGGAESTEFGLRILPVEVAAQAVAWRMELAPLKLSVPRCVGHDPVTGWILEEWLPGRSAERDDFSVAREAMRCVAQLHRASLANGNQRGMKRRLAPMDLLTGVPGIQRVPDWVWRPLDVQTTGWIHGDLHPHQVLVGDGQASLLDLDSLRPGAPEEDLASWAADALAMGAARDLEEFLGELVDLYRSEGGGAVDLGLLRALTALELLERAASAIRHVEADAVLRAARLVSMVSAASVAEPYCGN